ncbi:hypothetical protein HanIR_Chr03g0116201 [Helianthus annuus]|nr:hypothetical protein HanIR_Chr03g0116201 [Helianthus annuus]
MTLAHRCSLSSLSLHHHLRSSAIFASFMLPSPNPPLFFDVIILFHPTHLILSLDCPHPHMNLRLIPSRVFTTLIGAL